MNKRERRLIQAGDFVVLYFSRENLVPLIVEPGKTINNRYGSYKHEAFVSQPFGSKILSSDNRGFGYLLKPTPELWTEALPHRTQILYQPDIAFISSYLNLLPGQTVIESGTGSGSFSHAAARTLGKQGTLHSFEFHKDRYEQAQKEFDDHGLTQIKLQHRNVCKDGFGLQDCVDAVFLDLPSPWEAVPFAKEALRKDFPARICCFSPCIEQVLRTVASLGASGFSEITMYEALVRNYDALEQVKPAPTVAEAIAHLKGIENKKEARRQNQISRARAANAAKLQAKGEAGDAASTPTETEGGAVDDLLSADKQGTPATDADEEMGDASETPQASLSQAKGADRTRRPPRIVAPGKRKLTNVAKRKRSDGDEEDGEEVNESVLLARPLHQLRGHTSYLTFATLLPKPKQDISASYTVAPQAAFDV